MAHRLGPERIRTPLFDLMMIVYTDNDLLRLDEIFARQEIPFHARPFHAATQILGEEFCIGLGGNHQVDEICQAYERLIPEVRFTWPGMGTGLVASVDRVRKVPVGVVYGTINLAVHTGLGFSSQQEWFTWCRGDRKIADKSAFALADMYDLVYGIDRQSQRGNASTFWGLAAEQLKLASESLSQSGSISSPVLQPICLTAELAIKGTLLYLGISEKDLRNSKLFGHDLNKLGHRMTSERSHGDDALLLSALSNFPDYVGERYRETKLSRLDVISLALGAQFVAASAVRRISGDDMSRQIEAGGLGPRAHVFQG